MSKIVWLSIFAIVLIWSGVAPLDRFTWILEVAPAVIALLILAFSRNRFPLSPLLYLLILLHSVTLMIRGHYTYAEVPIFDWLAEQFDWQRNHYDKLGHFAQGFVPAMVARELLV
ncbi:MAG: putative membrane protein, partial [Zhongshania sp.]